MEPAPGPTLTHHTLLEKMGEGRRGTDDRLRREAVLKMWPGKLALEGL